jgi:hypothetical protein
MVSALKKERRSELINSGIPAAALRSHTFRSAAGQKKQMLNRRQNYFRNRRNRNLKLQAEADERRRREVNERLRWDVKEYVYNEFNLDDLPEHEVFEPSIERGQDEHRRSESDERESEWEEESEEHDVFAPSIERVQDEQQQQSESESEEEDQYSSGSEVHQVVQKQDTAEQRVQREKREFVKQLIFNQFRWAGSPPKGKSIQEIARVRKVKHVLTDELEACVGIKEFLRQYPRDFIVDSGDTDDIFFSYSDQPLAGSVSSGDLNFQLAYFPADPDVQEVDWDVIDTPSASKVLGLLMITL